MVKSQTQLHEPVDVVLEDVRIGMVAVVVHGLEQLMADSRHSLCSPVQQEC